MLTAVVNVFEYLLCHHKKTQIEWTVFPLQISPASLVIYTALESFPGASPLFIYNQLIHFFPAVEQPNRNVIHKVNIRMCFFKHKHFTCIAINRNLLPFNRSWF